jgi:nucleoside-diphosphate-sugar epimerase
LFPVKNGSYPNHAQVYDNVISVVQHFKKLGYRVALIGKQHYAPMANFPFEYLGGRNSDNEKIIKVYNWQPSTLLKDGLEKTYKWIYDQIIKKDNTNKFARF